MPAFETLERVHLGPAAVSRMRFDARQHGDAMAPLAKEINTRCERFVIMKRHAPVIRGGVEGFRSGAPTPPDAALSVSSALSP